MWGPDGYVDVYGIERSAASGMVLKNGKTGELSPLMN